jgi:hypothetical protein
MAATGQRWRRRPRLSLSLSYVNDTSRPRLDQGLRLEDILSAVIFAKEPLTFIILEPVVLGVIPEVRFFVLKTYFFSVISKYVF